MIERLLPRTIDNSYRGSKVALWILGFVAAVRTAMSVNSSLNGRTVLVTADGVPLATYPADASRTVVALFAIWAWAVLLFAFIAVLALVRYRGLTPLVLSLFVLEHAGRKVILQSLPIVRSATAPASWINATLLSLMLLGLMLSLWRRDAVAGSAAANA